MELILWRHAEAEPGTPGQPDDQRILTAKGRKQAIKMAEWLNRVLPDNCRMLASPTQRTVQTAEALGRKFQTDGALGTRAGAQDILRAARWPNAQETVLVVGHQPTLGRVASLLICGEELNWTMRKGSICWISLKADEEAESVYIKALLAPDMV